VKDAERRRFEEALRESETQLKRAQEIAHFGNYEITVPSSSEDHWSDELYRILGLDPSNGTLPREELMERIVHSEDRAHYLKVIGESIRDAKRYSFEYPWCVLMARSDSFIAWVSRSKTATVE
jgi:PAS domain-containing protein